MGKEKEKGTPSVDGKLWPRRSEALPEMGAVFDEGKIQFSVTRLPLLNW